MLPDDKDVLAVAEAAADQARKTGVRVAVIPTRATVQVLAALAVHDPARRFDDDVVAMTSAARATRHAEVTLATQGGADHRRVCQPGDVLGSLEGDVAVIGADVAEVARALLDRLLPRAASWSPSSRARRRAAASPRCWSSTCDVPTRRSRPVSTTAGRRTTRCSSASSERLLVVSAGQDLLQPVTRVVGPKTAERWPSSGS